MFPWPDHALYKPAFHSVSTAIGAGCLEKYPNIVLPGAHLAISRFGPPSCSRDVLRIGITADSLKVSIMATTHVRACADFPDKHPDPPCSVPVRNPAGVAEKKKRVRGTHQ